MDEFPPNSRKKAEQRASQAEPKRVERVVSADAVRRRKPLGKRFHDTFFGGDAKTAFEYMVVSTLMPLIKDAMFEAVSSGWEKLVYGDGPRHRRGPRGMTAPQSGPQGYVAYNQHGPPRAQRQQEVLPALPRRSRSRHSFDDIVIDSRREAEEVLERMYDLLDKFNSVTVADLYELTGIASSHTDHKWGWTNLSGSNIGRDRSGGYVIQLPDPAWFQ